MSKILSYPNVKANDRERSESHVANDVGGALRGSMTPITACIQP